MRLIRFVVSLSLFIFSFSSSLADQGKNIVVNYKDSDLPLLEKWNRARTGATGTDYENGFWIGYSIEKLMGKNSFIGSYSSDWKEKTKLSEIIYGKNRDAEEQNLSEEEVIRHVAEETLDDFAVLENEEKVVKEIALLFRFSGSRRPEKLRLTNLDLHFELDDLPLVWLGRVEDKESIDLLTKLYGKLSDVNIKKDIVFAVSTHDLPSRVVPFLRGVVKSNEDIEIRKSAIFWLGQQNSPEAIRIVVDAANSGRSSEIREGAVFAISQFKSEQATDKLIDLALNSRHDDVREKAIFWLGQKNTPKALNALLKIIKKEDSEALKEKAVFSISQMSSCEAVDALIELARNAVPYSVRKKALFWLGQKASQKAAKALGDVVYSDKEIEIQEYAVFALYQLPNKNGIPALIRISTDHPSPRIRKKALFWLGQTDDPRAVEAIVKILKRR